MSSHDVGHVMSSEFTDSRKDREASDCHLGILVNKKRRIVKDKGNRGCVIRSTYLGAEFEVSLGHLESTVVKTLILISVKVPGDRTRHQISP